MTQLNAAIIASISVSGLLVKQTIFTTFNKNAF